MANKQSKVDKLETRDSVSSLRELNFKLIAEIAELRKENFKISELRREKDLLMTRIVELERSTKENTNQSSVYDISTEIRNSNDISTETLNSNDTPNDSSSDITDKTLNSNDTYEQIILYNVKSNTFNLDIYQEEETIKKEIIENIKKSQNQELLSTPENTIPKISISSNKNVSISEAEKSLLNKDLNIQNTKLSSSESKSSIISSFNQKQSAISSEIKIPYNQKVEQGLICELSIFINEKSLLNSIPDRQILENMLDGDDSTSGSASHLDWSTSKLDVKNVSNTEVSPNNTTHIFNSSDVDEIGEVSVPDSSLYFNSDPFDDENSCDRDTDPQSEDGDFFDNDKEEDDDGFCGFSDDDDEGYYYDLNTGETYTKSDRSICAY
ncbi:7951_t:CDS:2 [Ambispora gerdemannii]|uniref:7951_t:CDS:1 n=1 Tax=Ambispora gerdemannii TaxID=144530 RepID=A0A9N9DAZ5_9GLOM|nr:7951_t:CDS:2 [Ambispora gerdemannii]